MKIIDRINDSAFQKMTLLTEETGEKIFCTLSYLPTQFQWVLDIQYQDFTLNGISVLNSPNILRGYKNILSFGIGISTNDGFDPYYIEDFSSGRAQFYLLNTADVEEAESRLNEV